MENQISQKLKLNSIFSTIILLLGLTLITYIISVEGELGALPLLLTVVGLTWFCITMYSIKNFKQKASHKE